MDLPPLESDLHDRLREDIRRRGIQVPILVDNATGDVIDVRLHEGALRARVIPPGKADE